MIAKAKIRKIATFVEETDREMDREVSPPTKRAAAVAVIENPYAGKYVEDLSELMEIGEELGELLTARAVAALGILGPSAESYGKAAAVGENGELEHDARNIRWLLQTKPAQPPAAMNSTNHDSCLAPSRNRNPSQLN